MKHLNNIVNFLGALLVKFAFYFLASVLFILLFWWAGIIEGFFWKYAVVLALGILFLRIFIAEIFVKMDTK